MGLNDSGGNEATCLQWPVAAVWGGGGGGGNGLYTSFRGCLGGRHFVVNAWAGPRERKFAHVARINHVALNPYYQDGLVFPKALSG